MTMLGNSLCAFALVIAVVTPARAAEPFALDESTKRNFSSSAAHTSDLLLAVTLLTPLALQAGQGMNQETGQRTLVYGETLAVSLALNGATKVLVGRARPYTYNHDPHVEAYAAGQGNDARRSFHSGHASTAFAAAVSGSLLFADGSDDVAARTSAWATSLFLAGATANLRVRAGKHFPTDVLVGALVGAGLGVAFPALQGHTPRGGVTAAEWTAIVAAPLAGALAGQLLPMKADVTLPLGATGTLSPMSLPGGAGVQIAGRWP